MESTNNLHKKQIQSDAQSDQNSTYIPLQFVGMDEMQTALLLSQAGREILVPVNAEMGVDLQRGHRGIHMSRLYQIMMEQVLNKKLSTQLIQSVLCESLNSQNDLSTSAYLNFSFEWPRMTQSLKSQLPGFRKYPVTLRSRLENGKISIEIQFQILYSSTCPQSLRLAKEFAQGQSELSGDQNLLPATPHAQRSEMTLNFQLLENSELNIEKWISFIEEKIKTPVQTAVKKADEMEFARLNGQNPLFCEDAIRVIAASMGQLSEVVGYKISTVHRESLHPHNAKSQILSNYSPW